MFAPVVGRDHTEFGASLLPGRVGVDLENVELNGLTDVQFRGVSRPVEGQRSLVLLSVLSFGKANLPCIALGPRNLPNATLLISCSRYLHLRHLVV